ncbi:putative MICOS complex subunit Mic10 [Hypsibius exemplaris]|uniref:MICOS complex subunit MIC10 n=1 Tax=Hypsibius exemplaris TaxID=2072580 RepID=A0A1W0X3J9_HYPEX|nr:putative MICOS complex subunit Mic10 [Hypsibius exemplaris]
MPHHTDVAAVAVKSEDELGRKWDHCISDSVIKFGGGIALGGLFSLLFFKRKAWPLVFGSGAGLGMSYSNCQHELRHPYVHRPARKCQNNWPVALTPGNKPASL